MPESSTHSLHDGKLQLRTRNGLWQARVYLGERRYLWRSLKTVDVERANAQGKAADDNGTPVLGEFQLSSAIADHHVQHAAL
jgi:hypothetical protein